MCFVVAVSYIAKARGRMRQALQSRWAGNTTEENNQSQCYGYAIITQSDIELTSTYILIGAVSLFHFF